MTIETLTLMRRVQLALNLEHRDRRAFLTKKTCLKRFFFYNKTTTTETISDVLDKTPTNLRKLMKRTATRLLVLHCRLYRTLRARLRLSRESNNVCVAHKPRLSCDRRKRLYQSRYLKPFPRPSEVRGKETPL